MWIALALILLVAGVIGIGVGLVAATAPNGGSPSLARLIYAGMTAVLAGTGVLVWRVASWIGHLPVF
jgi:hypothetical protein